MNATNRLAACSGRWHGTNTLHHPQTNRPEESEATAVVTPVLRGTFVRIDYTWSCQGHPQEGSLLCGCEQAIATVTVHWIDTWHMGRAVMACRGQATDSGPLSARGTYAAPPGPDWGWQIDIYPDGREHLRILMRNIRPDGREEPAVEAVFRPTED